MPHFLVLARAAGTYGKFWFMYEVYLWLQVFMRKLSFQFSMSLSLYKSYFNDHVSLFAVRKLNQLNFQLLLLKTLLS